MNYTANYNLKKPEGTDTVNIDDFNNNADILDTEINSINEQIDTLMIQDDSFREQINNLDTNKADLIGGKVPSSQLPMIEVPEVPVQSVNNKTGNIVLVKSDVGLGNVDNTADSAKNVLGATKLTTARTINGVAFDGTANITIADSTKAPISHSHTKSNITDFPTSLPANGGTSAICSGNASTATTLQTARTINGVSFNGSANITIADGTKAPIAHSSTGTTYGLGTTANYGHVKTINALTQESHVNGTALSAFQGKVLSDMIGTIGGFKVKIIETYGSYTGANLPTSTKLAILSGKFGTKSVYVDSPSSSNYIYDGVDKFGFIIVHFDDIVNSNSYYNCFFTLADPSGTGLVTGVKRIGGFIKSSGFDIGTYYFSGRVFYM